MSISAMKQALEALERGRSQIIGALVQQDQDEAITALRQAIAEAEKQEPWVKTYCGGKPNYTTPAEKQEPVAWREVAGKTTHYYDYNEDGRGEPLYATPVHAIDMSQERVDETAKRKHDCNKCENRGRVLGDSQESYCENCIYGSPWKKDYYKEKNA